MVNAVEAKQWLGDFDALVARLESGSLGVVQALYGLGRTKLDAAEARALAAEVGADGDTRRAARIAAMGGKRSKSAARAAAKRAKAIAENDDLASAMASGDLSTEQIDTIAGAMSTDSSAATDQELIDAVAKSSVSEGRKAARDWQARKTDKAAAHAEHERQRKLRRAFQYNNKTKGLATITLEGDDATIAEIWNLVRQRERSLREADGGRDLPAGKHPRSLNQRLFDAMAELVRGEVGGISGRPSIVLTVPVDGSVARIAGRGTTSDTVVHDLLTRARVSVAIVDNITAEPLAWGRLKRNATTQQFLALVVRDQGCVLCDAAWSSCQAHHLTPWHAPAKGRTNVDELVLLCSDCHHHVHAAKLTVIRNASESWSTRPATAPEIAPTCHDKHASRPRERRRRTGRPNTSTENASRAADTGNPELFQRPGGRTMTAERSGRGADDDDAAASAMPVA